MSAMVQFIEHIDEIASDVFSQTNKSDIIYDKREFIDLICNKQNYLQKRWKVLQDKYSDHPRLQSINSKVFRAWYDNNCSVEHKKYVKEQFNLQMEVYSKKKQLQSTSELVKSDIQDIDYNKKIEELEKENAKLQNLYDIEKKAKETLKKSHDELKEELTNSKDTEIQYLKELRLKDNEINMLKAQLNK